MKKTMKVYVVKEYCSSHYSSPECRVVGVFATKASARKTFNQCVKDIRFDWDIDPKDGWYVTKESNKFDVENDRSNDYYTLTLEEHELKA